MRPRGVDSIAVPVYEDPLQPGDVATSNCLHVIPHTCNAQDPIGNQRVCDGGERGTTKAMDYLRSILAQLYTCALGKELGAS
jgi:hypothetical protein